MPQGRFNSSKVQLEQDKDEIQEIVDSRFNSSKVQLELNALLILACVFLLFQFQ